MARPSPNAISSGLSSWDTDIGDNFDLIFETPLPLARYASVGALPTASDYEDCIAIVEGTGLYYCDGSTWTALALGNPLESIILALGDETTAISTGTSKVTFRMPYAFALTAVRASVNTVSSSGVVTVDINEGGTTILSTKLTIDASEKTSTTAATPAVISDANLADDAEITLDIDTAGTGAKGLKVILIGRQV